MSSQQKLFAFIGGIIGLLAVTIAIVSTLPSGAGDVTPTPYTRAVSCPDCSAAGMEINLWDSIDRTRVVGTVPDGQQVTILDREYNRDEARFYYQVRYEGVTGWLPDDFVLR